MDVSPGAESAIGHDMPSAYNDQGIDMPEPKRRPPRISASKRTLRRSARSSKSRDAYQD
jgi:hypothetical protein